MSGRHGGATVDGISRLGQRGGKDVDSGGGDVHLVIGVGEVSHKVHHINGPDRDDCAIVSRVDNIILGISHSKNKEYAPGCSRSLALSPVPRKERDLPARDSQFWQLSPRIWKWQK